MDGMTECKIAPAFVKAKREFTPAKKNSVNPHFKSTYADLAACIEAVDPAFLNNGIVLYQETSADENGVTVETKKRTVRAKQRSTSSPARWPCWSLTCLK